VRIHLSTPGDGNINANMGIMAVGVPCSWLFLNGVLAFFLNVVSFNANRRVGPLGMGVACTWVFCSFLVLALSLGS
jgi:hypothetical protein